MTAAAQAYSAGYLEEDEPLLRARRRADAMGVVPVSPGGGAALRLLAAVASAKSVVEIGTGTGVSTLWLLRGMRRDGVLTSVDLVPEHQRLARQAVTEAGFASNRVRLIAGQALDVLSRLADAQYDLVFCDADPAAYPAYLEEALRLLRPSGTVVFAQLLNGCAEPEESAGGTEPLVPGVPGELLAAIRSDQRLLPCLLPVDDGLLCAVRA